VGAFTGTAAVARRRRGANVSIIILSVLLAISIALAFASFLHGQRWADFGEKYLLKVANQQSQAQQLAKDASEAVRADEAAFTRLAEIRDTIQRGFDQLKRGEPNAGLPPSPQEVATQLRAAEDAWRNVSKGADTILEAKDSILQVPGKVVETRTLLTELSKSADGIAQMMATKKESPVRVLTAARMVPPVERMFRALGELLEGGAATQDAIDRGLAAAQEFSTGLSALTEGDEELSIEPEKDPQIRKALEETGNTFQGMMASAQTLMDLVPTAVPALAAPREIAGDGVKLGSALDALIQLYRQTPGRLKVGPITAGPDTVLVFGASAGFFMLLLAIQLLRDARRREAESKAQNDANQHAILRLLDEMGNLADGDLTVETTVTEDVTGAIADSINATIDALRGLVTTINATSERVSESAQATRVTTDDLAAASEIQARETARATEAIKAITTAIDAMATDASESADVASRSVKVAGRGAETVRATIQGMDQIREQIQETAKRIKRLGESSQEIGEIVELIDDIADQTNILALNAAMQAAMAGEAGRGFAVVADEVQRLAERSRNATKQIEALVRAIQADTNEAVSSMEASTAGVVEGAKLAENAGAALQETENVSNYIAELTQRIAESAQRQSLEAGAIDATVTRVQDITQRSTEGTRKTAQSVQALTELAVDLQRSVAGFRLPQ
jgi:twitching motility protein PilJ